MQLWARIYNMYLLKTFFPHKHLKPPFAAFFLVLFSLTCYIGRFVSMRFCARMHISRVYAFKFKESIWIYCSNWTLVRKLACELYLSMFATYTSVYLSVLMRSFIALGIYRAITVWAASVSEITETYWFIDEMLSFLRFFFPYFWVFQGVPASQADQWVFLGYSGFWWVFRVCSRVFRSVYYSWFYKHLFAGLQSCCLAYQTCWLPLRS